MKRRNERGWSAIWISAGLVVCTALTAIATMSLLVSSARAQEDPARARPVVEQPIAVSAVRGLLYARPFTLRQPYIYTFLREQPAITRGLILVLEVNPEAAKPRQVDVSVLYAGDTPAHLTNTGYPTGRMIVIIPDWIDLAEAPIYFGSTELPERVDRARGAREMTTALSRTAQPFAPEVLAAAFAGGGERLLLSDSVELFRVIADLINRYVPEENAAAEIYRTPLVEE